MQRRVPRRVAVALAVTSVAATLAAPAATARPGKGVPATAAPVDDARVQPGEVLLKAAPGARGLERAIAAVSGSTRRVVGRGVQLVSVPKGREMSAAARLTADPAVAFAEPNYFRTTAGHADSEIGWGLRRVQAPALWARETPLTGDGVRIAVVDSGVHATHPDLAGRVVEGFDAYKSGGVDNCGHGTAVAGVAAADHDGDGLAGVAPGATVVPVKVLTYSPYWSVCGSGDAELIDGIYWAAHPKPSAQPRADIINLSLSGPAPSRLLEEALDYASSKGLVIVAAAGNDGNITVNYPAAYRNVVSVGGAKRSKGALVWWNHSSFGAVDVVAPAKSIPVIQAPGLPMGDRCTVAGVRRVCADGTSFAAPHVAGLAALLWEQHRGVLDTLAPTARVRRVRQWLAGTAVDLEGTPAAMDLKTGHGFVSGAAAAVASTDPDRTLVTWQAAGRILAPWQRMATAPLTLPARLILTNGLGEGTATRQVSFTTTRDASVSPTSAETTSEGSAETVLRSAADGRPSRITATVAGGPTAHLVAYVLDRDDNVPGVALRPSPFRDSLNVVDDFDDVFRLRLRDGETVHARVGGLGPREDVAVYLHRGSTKDVSNPTHPPLREDSQAYEDDWTRLKRTVRSDGIRYLHTNGYGTYRLRWWIVSPGKVRNASASPSPFTPDGDGRRDRTRITWRVRNPGNVKVKIRNSGGRVVKARNLGRVSDGAKRIRWNGRNKHGNLVRAGRYKITVRWSNNAGRVSMTATKVTVKR